MKKQAEVFVLGWVGPSEKCVECFHILHQQLDISLDVQPVEGIVLFDAVFPPFSFSAGKQAFMGVEHPHDGFLERFLPVDIQFHGFFNGQIDDRRPEPILQCQMVQCLGIEKLRRAVVSDDGFPELPTLAAVQDIEMKAVRKPPEYGFLDIVQRVGDPDDPSTRRFQDAVDPVPVRNLFFIVVPTAVWAQDRIRLIHDDKRSRFPIGHVQAGDDGAAAVQSRIAFFLDDPVGGDIQLMGEAIRVGLLPRAGFSIEQDVGGGLGLVLQQPQHMFGFIFCDLVIGQRYHLIGDAGEKIFCQFFR